MAILEVSGLVKKFDGFVAVDDISFTLNDARITGLLGPNGAGKTTTIYLILGLITPTAGEIRIFGKDIRTHRQEILTRMNFSSAYVSLPSNLKVRENLMFFSYLYGVRDWEKRADYLLERFELRETKNKKAGELSSGQHTRLNLVKALLNSPCFLCLDEPTASLDPLSARIVRRQLQEISRADRVTIFYTSHNMREVEEICDEVIFLHHGKIRTRTTPRQIMDTLKTGNMEDVFIELTREGGTGGACLTGGTQAFVLRIWGLVIRHVFLLPRNFARWLDIFYWPLMDLLVWGYTTVYLNSSKGGAGINFVVLFIGALISWDVLFRAQQSITMTFLEDVWSRNILNLFVSPLTPTEFLLGSLVFGMLRHFLTMTFMALIAFWLYDYNYFSLGFYLVPAILNLLLFGWALGIVTTALILRYGQSAEVLAWGLAFIIQPFVGVFYPVETLPQFFQAVSRFLPPTYVFTELRHIVIQKQYVPGYMLVAFGLNLAYLFAARLFFNWLWRSVKQKGYLTRLGNE